MRPSVVICGTYHRDSPGLLRLFKELEVTGCRILSPISPNFQDISVPVVRAEHEDHFSIDDLERWHLRALHGADFVMVHAPNGHIGVSGAYEIGYANALGKPVFCLRTPADEMLATRVRTVCSVFEALDQLQLVPF